MDLIYGNKIGFIGSQKTVKQDYLVGLLREIGGNKNFKWNWLPARGK